MYLTGDSVLKEDFNNNYGIYQHQQTDLTFPYDEGSIMQYHDRNLRSKVKHILNNI